MPDDFSIERVVAATAAVDRYHASLRYGAAARYEIDIDEGAGYQHVLFGLAKAFPQAEAFWHGDRGLGRKSGWQDWLELQIQPSPLTLHQSADMVGSLPVASVGRQHTGWEVVFDLAGLPARENPREFFDAVFGTPRTEDTRVFLDELVRTAAEAEASLIVDVGLDLVIRELRATVRLRGRSTEVIGVFTRPSSRFAPFPQAKPRKRGMALPIEIIAMPMPDLGGWSRHRHCVAAQAAVDLIESTDSPTRPYQEIYNNAWSSAAYTNDSAGAPVYGTHHPILVGTHYEDNDNQFPPAPYLDWFEQDERFKNTPNVRPGDWMRSMHHFGGYGNGLPYQWYFAVLDFGTNVPDPEVGDSYYSARDWGYGLDRADESHNLMTFTEAIRQYNAYTEEGKLKAYVMLGHVVHLLQDQGQPDHARLHDHGGSGFNEEELYEKYQICTIRATLIAAIAGAACGPFYFACFGVAFAAALTICIESADPHEVGFEKLTGSGRPTPAPGAVIPFANYDMFFAQMAARSTAAADRRGLSSPLGCGDLWLPPPLWLAPTLDPNIHDNNPAEYQPYLDLYDEVVPQMVGISAGLIRHFYEVVNHPPYVERVCVVKGIAGRAPVVFGQLVPGDGEDPAPRYDAEWENDPVQPDRRRKRVVHDDTVSPAHHAYVFVRFGPNLPPQGHKAVHALAVEAAGTAADGTNVSQQIPMREAPDGEGPYYWGSFQPANPTSEPYRLTLSVSAIDTTAHLESRPAPGSQLDADPSSMARADVLAPPLHPLLDYSPGVDRNHSLSVGPRIAGDVLEPNDTFETATHFDLQEPVMYPALTLHTEADVDRFRITFPTDAFDLGGTTAWSHDVGGGLVLHYSPPGVSIVAEELYGAALTAELHRSNLAPYPVALPESARQEIVIVAPRGEFADMEFYLTLTNPDFAGQGPLMYSLSASYQHGMFTLHGRLIPDYDYLLPLPPEEYGYQEIGDPVERIQYRDAVSLGANLRQYQQRYVRLLRARSEREARRLDATLRAGLGRAANAARQYEDAVRELSEAATAYAVERDRQEAPVQDLLQKIYTKLGLRHEADAAAARLKELGPFEPYPEALRA